MACFTYVLLYRTGNNSKAGLRFPQYIRVELGTPSSLTLHSERHRSN